MAVWHPKGMMQSAFRDGGRRLLPDGGPDPTDTYDVLAARRPATDRQPERVLMLAVVEDGLEAFRRHAFARDPKGREAFTEARDWLWATDRHWPFAFLNLCDTLDLDAEAIRAALTAWLASQRASARRARRAPTPDSGTATSRTAATAG